MNTAPLSDHFQHCPRCGAGGLEQQASRYFVCRACDFRFYLNAATAAGGIITDDKGHILLIRRARNPGLGKFAVPGGFVDEGERAEEAVIREVREEVGLEVTGLHYLATFPNQYEFGGNIYPVLDLYFVCDVASCETRAEAGEVSEIVWMAPQDINLDEIAFPSIRRAIETFMQSRDLSRDL